LLVTTIVLPLFTLGLLVPMVSAVPPHVTLLEFKLALSYVNPLNPLYLSITLSVVNLLAQPPLLLVTPTMCALPILIMLALGLLALAAVVMVFKLVLFYVIPT
jgi:hypothetical protein